jgi:hypothetical protein
MKVTVFPEGYDSAVSPSKSQQRLLPRGPQSLRSHIQPGLGTQGNSPLQGFWSCSGHSSSELLGISFLSRPE